MPKEIVSLEWIRDQVFLLKDRSDYPILMTQPDGVNGADLLPLSVIGCAAWDVVSILKKQRQLITALQVSADSVRESEPPWRFQSIHIHYSFSGHQLDPQSIERAIELSETKYCSTYATLRQVVEISSDYEIIERFHS